MATQGKEGGSAPIIEADWVPILAALVAVLSFLLTGIPEAPIEIVLDDVILVALVAIVVYRIESHRTSAGRKTLFRGRPGRASFVAAIALGVIGGTLAELASSASNPPAISIYERQVQKEVLGPLRETSADAFKEPASLRAPDLYAKNARDLSEAYDLASKVLEGIKPPRLGDQGLHSLLVVRLSAVGAAYAQLGAAVDEGAGTSKIAATRAGVRGSIEDLKEAEEMLDRRGYRVSLAPQ